MANDKKVCLRCNKNKPLNQFYRTNDENRFDDDRYHTCSVCVKEEVGEKSGEKLSVFLHEINRPFLKEVWNESLGKKGHVLGEYLRTIASSPKYKDLSFSDSDIKIDTSRFALRETRPHIFDKENVMIVLDDELRNKWMRHDGDFDSNTILELELFCRNMKYDYEIDTTAKESMLEELSVLNLSKRKLLIEKDFANYQKASGVYKSIMTDAGFRPIDKKDNLEKTGIDSFSEIISQLERDGGFIAPRRIEYEPDDIDKMLTYYIRWAQKFTDQSVSTEEITDWKDIEIDNHEFEVDSSANSDYEEDSLEEETDENVIE